MERKTPLSLYVHIPFCRSRCHYCNFNTYAGLEGMIPAYVEALVREIGVWAEAVEPTEAKSIFFGGGTPSLLSHEELGRILEAVHEGFQVGPDAEITLEANPESAQEDHLKEIRDLRFNRLSLGVQSFNDAQLQALGRIHSASEALAAYQAARKVGFSNINLDLIYGLPVQSLESWEQTIKQTLKLEPEHLSLYALSIEEETPLYQMVGRGEVREPDPDLAADMYQMAEEMLAEAGYQHYEISNWAKEGHQCQQNLTYWWNGPYLGFGAGASSCFHGYRFTNVPSPGEYIGRLHGEPSWGRHHDLPTKPLLGSLEVITPELERAESLILGLRLIEGVNLEGFQQRYGLKLDEYYRGEIRELVELGLLEEVGPALRLTRRGRLLGNEVFLRFLPRELDGCPF